MKTLDTNQIMMNLKKAFNNLMVYRLLASSPTEKVADLPLLAVIIAALMAPRASVVIAVVALLTGHRFRLEKDFVVRT